MHASEKETERVQSLRLDFWLKIQAISPENLIFIDECGVNLSLIRQFARAPKGKRAYSSRPQKRSKNVSVIGAIGLKGKICKYSLLGATDGLTFEAFISQHLVPQLWEGACVVILVKTNLKTNACSHVILFSSDLTLSFEKIIDYYKLRFQIEFNFRDAKQFFGLEDFMNLSQTAVTNASNLAFFMANLSHHLLADFQQFNPGSGIVDLKAYHRSFRYVREMLKMLPEIPEPILLTQIFAKLTALGRIHPVSTGVEPS